MYLRAIEWGVEDIFDATTFIVKQAEQWDIDKDQIVLMFEFNTAAPDVFEAECRRLGQAFRTLRNGEGVDL